jgi:hypothetical protein
MQHYTKNTVRTLLFCNVCNRKTMHRVDGGRVGCCMELHVSGLNKAQGKTIKKEHGQLSLF